MQFIYTQTQLTVDKAPILSTSTAGLPHRTECAEPEPSLSCKMQRRGRKSTSKTAPNEQNIRNNHLTLCRIQGQAVKVWLATVQNQSHHHLVRCNAEATNRRAHL